MSRAVAWTRARKRYGQHYLVDSRVAERIAALVQIAPSEVVLEVGPGTGALTAPLIRRLGRIVAVEIDGYLVSRLRERFGPEHLRLVEGDVLRLDLEALCVDEHATRLSIAGNLPYNITGPLLFRLLEQRRSIGRAVLMVQREVARRLVAGPGSREYGRLTVLLGLYAEIRMAMEVPPRAFRPVPRVDSAVVECQFREQPRCPVADEGVFRQVVHMAFGQRRKMLRNSLARMLTSSERPQLPGIAQRAGIDLAQRPEQLSVTQFARLSDEFALCRRDSGGDRQP